MEDLGVDGRVILKWVCMFWVRTIDLIDLAQVRDR